MPSSAWLLRDLHVNTRIRRYCNVPGALAALWGLGTQRISGTKDEALADTHYVSLPVASRPGPFPVEIIATDVSSSHRTLPARASSAARFLWTPRHSFDSFPVISSVCKQDSARLCLVRLS